MGSKTLKASIVIGGSVSSAFRNALTSTKSGFKGIGDAIATVERRQRLLGRGIQTFGRMGKDVSLMRREYSALAREADRLREAQSRLARVQSRIDANLARRSALQGKMFGAVAAAAAFAAPVKAAIDFESTMADVKKVVNFDTPVQFKQMGKDVLKLSTQLPMAASGIGQIVAAAGQAGIARKELIGFATDAVKMGVAFDLTADQAGGMMATWRTAFHMSQNQVRTLADQVNYLGNTGKATAAQISTVVTKVGPLGLTAGLSAAQVGALGSAMVSMGAQEDVASTAIKRMALNLTQGGAATKRQREAFHALGMKSTQVAKDMQKDATGTILRVLAAVKKLPKAQQSSIMSQLFGAESLQAIAPLLNNLDLLRERFRDVGDASKYTGSMQKEYASRAATTANNLQLLKNQATAAGVAMGSVLLPAVNSVAGILGKSINTVADLADKYPTMTKVVIGGAAALASLNLVATAGGYAFTFMASPVFRTMGFIARWRAGGAIAAMGNFGKAVRGVGMAFRWMGRAVLANPIILIGAAIAGVAYEIYRHWDGVKAFFSKLWGDIKNIFSGELTFLKGLFTGDFGMMADGVKKIFNGLKSFFGDFFKGIADGLKTLLDDTLQALGLLDRKKHEKESSKEQAARKAKLHEWLGRTGGGAVFRPRKLQELMRLNSSKPKRTYKWNTGSAEGTLPPAPAAGRGSAAAAAGGKIEQHNTYHITQQPGESGEDLARRIAKHTRHQDAINRRGSLADEAH